MDYPSIAEVSICGPNGRTIRRGVRNPQHGDLVKYTWWVHQQAGKQDTYQQILEWAEANNAFLVMHREENDGAMRLPYLFTIYDKNIVQPGDTINDVQLIAWTNDQGTCWDCDAALTYPVPHCVNCGAGQVCNGCRRITSDATSPSYYDGILNCSQCSITCNACETSFNSGAYSCPNCGDSCRCYYCNNFFAAEDGEWMEDHPEGDIFACSGCFEALCQGCWGVFPSRELNEDHYCSACSSRSIGEVDDVDAESELTIPSIPGRENILLCGVEIEGSNGRTETRTGNRLARTLQDMGLSYYGEMTGYHSAERSSMRGFKVHVERDGSVDWEMVVGPINMANEDDVQILDRSVKTVRGMIREGTARLDMRAGLHIHVEAARVPMEGAYNLYRYYMFMEDFLYRIGAAKWPFHRAILGGRGHPEKNPEAVGKLNFARQFTGNRYYGLSFDNYFARYYASCHCGARTYGMFEECTCNLGKCTFEFRLFNTTANTTKVHAYLALCQALVAKATENPDNERTIPEVNQEDYPSFDFYRGKVKEFSPTRIRTYKRKWEKCVEFMNNELPLTDEERRSLYYCVANSEIADIVQNSGILLEEKGE
jgi:hypothetical protein